jgi:uncharacterized protein YeaO (DUF488 family)
MSHQRQVRVRRVYDDPDADDGLRAPSTELRRWYGHDPDRFAEFMRRYQVELTEPERAAALAHLRELAADQKLTLLTATKQPEISQAQVLAQMLRG